MDFQEGQTSEEITTERSIFSPRRRVIKEHIIKPCEFCTMTFKARTTLYKHMIKQHPEEWSLKQIKKQMERQFQCKFCKCKFRYKNNLSSHMKNKHKNELSQSDCSVEDGKRKIYQNFCKEDGCDASFNTVEQLKNHLQKQHRIDFETAEITFTSFNAFEDWRRELEKETIRFMPRMKWPRADGGFSQLFKCMRSGIYLPTVTEENRKRRLKIEGSYKIGQHCPARLTVLSYPSGVTKVKACLTHYGHEFDGKYTLGFTKQKNKKKKRDDDEYSGFDNVKDEPFEVVTSRLATQENLRDQAKDLCGFLQGLLTTADVGEDNLAQIIMNLNASVELAGWKATQESEFLPVNVVDTVKQIEAHEKGEEPMRRIISDTSKYKSTNVERRGNRNKREQQEEVQEYLITENPYEQYIIWS